MAMMNSHLRALFLFVLTLAACCSLTSSRMFHWFDNEKVSLALYYETLCPYSTNFIINHLNKLVNDDEMMKTVDLRLIPYGNTNISNRKISCQRGGLLCVLNKVEACAIDAYPSLSKHFPFIKCVEEYYSNKSTNLGACYYKLGINLFSITDCLDSRRGDTLELKYVFETYSLQPPLEYVPWVTINGKPLYRDYEHVITHICHAYNGTKKPKACNNGLTTTLESKKHQIDGKNNSTEIYKGCMRGEGDVILN